MIYVLLVFLTVISCILFESSKMPQTLKALKAAYSLQFKVMSDKSISDEVKQKMLLNQISKQVLLLGKLIFGIFLFVAPFLSLYILQRYWPSVNPDILLSWYGILIPIVTAALYIFLKRNYGKLFDKR